MTKPTLTNSLYEHLESTVNQALPLEYAIRAMRKDNPKELAQLEEIDARIRNHWRSLGASDLEIDEELLMDFAWDSIQVGFPMSRLHDRVYRDRTFVKLISQGIASARVEFEKEVDTLQIPATKYFRICDLLNGNDILGMMQSLAACLTDAKEVEHRLELLAIERKLKALKQLKVQKKKHEKKIEELTELLKQSPLGRWDLDHVGIEKFVRNVRTPIHLHPGMNYVAGVDSGRRLFGIHLDVDADFSAPDLRLQIREFLYQYAAHRQALQPFPNVDPVADELINEFLKDDLFGKITPHQYARLDGLMGPLAGLHCWDLSRLYQQRKGTTAPVDTALTAGLADYPKNFNKVTWDAMRKNYRIANAAINNVPFAKVSPRTPVQSKDFDVLTFTHC